MRAVDANAVVRLLVRDDPEARGRRHVRVNRQNTADAFRLTRSSVRLMGCPAPGSLPAVKTPG